MPGWGAVSLDDYCTRGHFVNYKYVDNTAKMLTTKQLSFS